MLSEALCHGVVDATLGIGRSLVELDPCPHRCGRPASGIQDAFLKRLRLTEVAMPNRKLRLGELWDDVGGGATMADDAVDAGFILGVLAQCVDGVEREDASIKGVDTLLRCTRCMSRPSVKAHGDSNRGKGSPGDHGSAAWMKHQRGVDPIKDTGIGEQNFAPTALFSWGADDQELPDGEIVK